MAAPPPVAPQVAALAGGVGAARLLRGVVEVADPTRVTAVVNTADDFCIFGLHVSPDLDTVTYTLAGAADAERGWGLAGETWQVMEALERYDPGLGWFRLGDRDLGTHLFRTSRRAQGLPLSAVTAEITRAWGVRSRILPMTDDTVETVLEVAGEGELAFQDYFVARRHAVPVSAVRFAGAEAARPAPGVLAALEAAERVVVCPSHPILSIAPHLAVPGLATAVAARRSRVVAVSPLVAGAALRGPAARLMAELGHEPTVVGVARLYAPLAGTLVIDEADAALVTRVEEEGLACVVAQTVMHDVGEASRLAETVLGAMSPRP